MDRIPRTEAGDVADDSIARQTPPPIVSFDRAADSKTQSAQVATGAILETSGEDGGAGDENSVTASNGRSSRTRRRTLLARLKHVLMTFGKFVGPGFMVSVAYIDPGNYSTDIAAGSSYRFKLLFIVLLSNLFAILLQSLAIQLGTVTGLDLASACRAYLPRWLNYFLYALAEVAIIATDIAEVIGTAIALNLLIPKLPLVAGCALSILDVMAILIFYRPDGSMKGLRIFEFFVLLLSDGLYQACGILGATVMPHSLYLGSGIVKPRLKDYDEKHGLMPQEPVSAASSTMDGSYDKVFYIPSLAAIKHCLKYSITELALSLFTFALFVNSAILIVAGASLYGNPDALTADIFGIHQLLSSSISSGAGTIFALALLLSGVSAGIVCTIAGQMVSEGALRWKIKPWLRRLITRSISITPSIIIAGAVGRKGLDSALNASQVVLSTVLPFVTFPLIYFTARSRYMMVQPGRARLQVESREGEDGHPIGEPATDMSNGWVLIILSALVWLLIAVMNVANLVLLGLGNS
ncbi:hypothetical protein TrVFT333_004340 [Trichoderma virens FT-333]|nr:hypothetical protein TrVFT333_004340 [Trichoderma virens FT-333]